MHDEASAHYMSMIDQTELGHKFLKDELNYIPTVGWQIDPFGHSKTHAWLSSEVGFDSLFFGRIDYQDHNKRMAEKNLEMIWKVQPLYKFIFFINAIKFLSQGSSADSSIEVFTGAFSSGNYGPPSGFCFDVSCHYCRDDPVVSDHSLENYNLDVKAAQFIEAILQEQSISRGNHIMLKMGADFTYDNANSWYKSMDKLIDKINAEDDRFNVFYSDPVTYTKARADEVDDIPMYHRASILCPDTSIVLLTSIGTYLSEYIGPLS